MHIVVDNGLLLWVPSYVLNDDQLGSARPALLLVELLASLLSALIVPSFIRIALRHQAFHVNMTRLIVVFNAHWYECLLARLLILPYESGWICVTEKNEPYTGFYTDNQAEMARASLNWRLVPLVVGSFLRFRYVAFVLWVLPAATIERAVATFWIKKYEKFSKTYLSTGILVLAYTVSIVFGLLNVFCRITLWHNFVVGSLASVFTGQVYIFLAYYNHRVLNNLSSKNHYGTYTLAKKFQARENVRLFKMIHYVISAVYLNTMAIAAILLCVYFNILLSSSMMPFWAFVAAALLDLNPLFIVPLMLFPVPTWRKALRKKRVRKSAQVSSQPPIADAAHETEAYFTQFQRMW